MNRRRRSTWSPGRLLAGLIERGDGSGTAARSGLIGRDLARTRLAAGRRHRLFPVALVGALLAALGLAALRVDGIRQRYALAAAMREEKILLEERDRLTAEVRSLRDPARLARMASRWEFQRPEQIIELDRAAVSAGPRP
jgi:hypothetical protein